MEVNPFFKSLIFFLFLFFASACTVDYSTFETPKPDWIADAVFYQIFPERFRNGDPFNDPDKHSLFGSYPHDTTSDWQLSPWTADWYKLQPWEKKNGKGLAYNLQRRRYGGDLQGIIEKLDYLKDLGVNALYLNPIFEAPSLHKYDAATYIHVDDNFGPNPQIDRKIVQKENPVDPKTWRWTTADTLFLKLLQEAHQRNIRVIIDGVFNHVGMTHWAFLDVQKRGPKSPFKDWFTILQWDDPSTPQNEFRYKGWYNVAELPELKEDEHGLIAPIREHIFAVVERWMDPNNDGDPSDGIDGWRLDVAEMVHHDFWKQFRKKVKSINPQAYLVGEIFWEDWQNNKLMNPAPWLQGDQFDGVMNYQWAVLNTRFFIDRKKKIKASEFVKGLQQLDKRYRPRFQFQVLNLMDSHDTDRLSSNIVNPDLMYDKHVSPYDNPMYKIRKPTEQERQVQRLVALFQFTVPGAPMIYYGTESGMWGGDDPDCRKPMVWSDLVYEPETVNVDQTPRPADSVFFDYDLFHYYRFLIHLRKKEIALRKGELKFVYWDDAKDVIAFTRTLGDERLMIVLNNSDHPQNVTLQMEGNLWIDLLTKEEYERFDGALNLKLRSKQGVILKRKSV